MLHSAEGAGVVLENQKEGLEMEFSQENRVDFPPEKSTMGFLTTTGTLY